MVKSNLRIDWYNIANKLGVLVNTVNIIELKSLILAACNPHGTEEIAYFEEILTTGVLEEILTKNYGGDIDYARKILTLRDVQNPTEVDIKKIVGSYAEIDKLVPLIKNYTKSVKDCGSIFAGKGGITLAYGDSDNDGSHGVAALLKVKQLHPTMDNRLKVKFSKQFKNGAAHGINAQDVIQDVIGFLKSGEITSIAEIDNIITFDNGVNNNLEVQMIRSFLSNAGALSSVMGKKVAIKTITAYDDELKKFDSTKIETFINELRERVQNGKTDVSDFKRTKKTKIIITDHHNANDEQKGLEAPSNGQKVREDEDTYIVDPKVDSLGFSSKIENISGAAVIAEVYKGVVKHENAVSKRIVTDEKLDFMIDLFNDISRSSAFLDIVTTHQEGKIHDIVKIEAISEVGRNFNAMRAILPFIATDFNVTDLEKQYGFPAEVANTLKQKINHYNSVAKNLLSLASKHSFMADENPQVAKDKINKVLLGRMAEGVDAESAFAGDNFISQMAPFLYQYENTSIDDTMQSQIIMESMKNAMKMVFENMFKVQREILGYIRKNSNNFVEDVVEVGDMKYVIIKEPVVGGLAMPRNLIRAALNLKGGAVGYLHVKERRKDGTIILSGSERTIVAEKKIFSKELKDTGAVLVAGHDVAHGIQFTINGKKGIKAGLEAVLKEPSDALKKVKKPKLEYFTTTISEYKLIESANVAISGFNPGSFEFKPVIKFSDADIREIERGVRPGMEYGYVTMKLSFDGDGLVMNIEDFNELKANRRFDAKVQGEAFEGADGEIYIIDGHDVSTLGKMGDTILNKKIKIIDGETIIVAGKSVEVKKVGTYETTKDENLIRTTKGLYVVSGKGKMEEVEEQGAMVKVIGRGFMMAEGLQPVSKVVERHHKKDMQKVFTKIAQYHRDEKHYDIESDYSDRPIFAGENSVVKYGMVQATMVDMIRQYGKDALVVYDVEASPDYELIGSEYGTPVVNASPVIMRIKEGSGVEVSIEDFAENTKQTLDGKKMYSKRGGKAVEVLGFNFVEKQNGERVVVFNEEIEKIHRPVLINEANIPKSVQDLTNISPEMLVVAGMTYAEADKAMLELLTDNNINDFVFIAHNALYDYTRLGQFPEFYKYIQENALLLDSMDITKGVRGGQEELVSIKHAVFGTMVFDNTNGAMDRFMENIDDDEAVDMRLSGYNSNMKYMLMFDAQKRELYVKDTSKNKTVAFKDGAKNYAVMSADEASVIVQLKAGAKAGGIIKSSVQSIWAELVSGIVREHQSEELDLNVDDSLQRSEKYYVKKLPSFLKNKFMFSAPMSENIIAYHTLLLDDAFGMNGEFPVDENGNIYSSEAGNIIQQSPDGKKSVLGIGNIDKITGALMSSEQEIVKIKTKYVDTEAKPSGERIKAEILADVIEYILPGVEKAISRYLGNITDKEVKPFAEDLEGAKATILSKKTVSWPKEITDQDKELIKGWHRLERSRVYEKNAASEALTMELFVEMMSNKYVKSFKDDNSVVDKKYETVRQLRKVGPLLPHISLINDSVIRYFSQNVVGMSEEQLVEVVDMLKLEIEKMGYNPFDAHELHNNFVIGASDLATLTVKEIKKLVGDDEFKELGLEGSKQKLAAWLTSDAGIEFDSVLSQALTSLYSKSNKRNLAIMSRVIEPALINGFEKQVKRELLKEQIVNRNQLRKLVAHIESGSEGPTGAMFDELRAILNTVRANGDRIVRIRPDIALGNARTVIEFKVKDTDTEEDLAKAILDIDKIMLFEALQNKEDGLEATQTELLLPAYEAAMERMQIQRDLKIDFLVDKHKASILEYVMGYFRSTYENHSSVVGQDGGLSAKLIDVNRSLTSKDKAYLNIEDTKKFQAELNVQLRRLIDKLKLTSPDFYAEKLAQTIDSACGVYFSNDERLLTISRQNPKGFTDTTDAMIKYMNEMLSMLPMPKVVPTSKPKSKGKGKDLKTKGTQA